MYKTNINKAIVTLMLVAATGTAYAGGGENGLTSNALTLNGWSNGLNLNGWSNGLHLNGRYANGGGTNGLSYNGKFTNGQFNNGKYENGGGENGLQYNAQVPGGKVATPGIDRAVEKAEEESLNSLPERGVQPLPAPMISSSRIAE